MELFFDTIQLIDIVVVFFTAVPYESVHPKIRVYCRQIVNYFCLTGKDKISNVVESIAYWETDIRMLALNYALNFFVFDFLACVPGLMTRERRLVVYPFKVLRILRLPRLLSFVESLLNSYKE